MVIETAQAIEAAGYEKLPDAIDISTNNGCDKIWPGSGGVTPGIAMLHQFDFRLKLHVDDFGKTFAGAIVKSSLVFLVKSDFNAFDDFVTEPLYGTWSGKDAVLTNSSGKCTITISASP